MKRVYHIITHFDLGGAEKVALDICKSQNNNFEYYIFEVVRGNSNYSYELIADIEASGTKFIRSFIPFKKIAILIFPIIFFFYTVRWPPDIIHTHTEIPDLSIFLYNKIANFFGIENKFIRTIHNNQLWNEWKIIGDKVESFFQGEKASIAISHSVKESYSKIFLQSDIPIIYNGINNSQQKVFKYLQKEKFNILFAGRLEQQKGIDELIHLVSYLSPNNLYHFHIIGNGSLKGKVNRELNGLANVSLYDSIYNLNQHISSFDYLFMPSNFEGLGLLSIEASLQKVPTIINDCLGLNETLPQDWPLKVQNNSVESYISIFENLLPVINRYDLGNIAFNYAEQKFAIKTMQRQYEQIYSELT